MNDIQDIIKQMPMPIAAQTLDDLKRSASERSGDLSQIGRRNPDNAVQIKSKGSPVEVWVKPLPYDGYREAWVKVFGSLNSYKQVWNRATGKVIDDNLEVDHVLSRKIASTIGYSYVRIFPVTESSNGHSGRTFEKNVSSNTSEQNTAGRTHFVNGIEYLDILGFAKILNYPLEHAFFKRKKPPPAGHLSKVQNKDFVQDYYLNPIKTLQILRNIGFIWWK